MTPKKSKYKNVFNNKYKCALCDKVYYEGSDNINGLGHIIHKDAGGDASLENLQLEHSVANRRQQNR